MARARALASAALALAAAGCSSKSLGPDAAAKPAPARCRFEEGFPDGGAAWQGTSARLVRRGPAPHSKARLVADVLDARGGTTEFLVDTGTSCAFVSSGAPVAATAGALSRRMRLVANEGATSFDGRDATIPSLAIGGLSAREVPVFLTDQPHDLRAPANVAGMAWLGSLSISHDAATDGWTLSRGGPASDAAPANAVRLAAPAFPIVSVVDDAGRSVYALIDTGTPTSLVDRGTRPGRFRVEAPDGRTLLEVRPKDVAPWTGLSPRGHDVAVWIGLDDLARASFTLDFQRGWWAFR